MYTLRDGVVFGVGALCGAAVLFVFEPQTRAAATTSVGERAAASAPQTVDSNAAVPAAADAQTAADEAQAATSAAMGNAETAADAAAAQRQFTKQSFDRYAYNRTKEQIRAEFGTPMSVHDDSDTWVYSNLPIFDAEAGTREMVSIRFAGIEGAQDFVVETSYQTAVGG